ncbi:hypothetical protein E1A91_D01G144500v1 [Gossypium mustelinum]|uniref:Uncharacterized protein n=3 Tax=Gossypium TaxID=3633 RepID=A0A5J5SP11_GOSBA|nr:hypothetical protein ES319_D01G138500v1 [Gossypium barbadense]TYG83207.1 hypothetical protein ES288_D01G150700v1 [Gossypium darwinii]TYI97454.1 hypothetical protein E1A91_D01G144500v1 [Gossypium mustelinum]
MATGGGLACKNSRSGENSTECQKLLLAGSFTFLATHERPSLLSALCPLLVLCPHLCPLPVLCSALCRFFVPLPSAGEFIFFFSSSFKIFQDLGFSTHDVADIVASDPWILTRSVDDRIAPSISDLKTVLGSNDDVVKLLRTSAWFLKSDLQKTMMPNIELLRNCGICSSQIVSYAFSFPRFFLFKPESIKQFVERADALGFDRKSNMFLAAIRMLSSVFRKLGFSEDDIMSTFRRTPQVFAVSKRKIKKVTDFLLNRTNVGISFIISHPMVLICSLERRLKPRLLVIETLESKNSLRRKVSMTTIYKMPDKKFREKYVVPYLKELEEVFMSIVGT